jgi:hypothetical protein
VEKSEVDHGKTHVVVPFNVLKKSIEIIIIWITTVHAYKMDHLKP